MWLLAGLGNPGPEYQKTRHNLGFMALDALAGRWKIPIVRSGRDLAVGKGMRRGEKIILAKPLAFMNRSGEIIGPLAEREMVGGSRILVIVDDLDLPLGTIRYRVRGGTAGHRGMESIVRHLGHEDFPRIRLGIGRPADVDGGESEYVLSPFSEAELAIVDQVTSSVITVAEKVVFEGMIDPVTLRISEN